MEPLSTRARFYGTIPSQSAKEGTAKCRLCCSYLSRIPSRHTNSYRKWYISRAIYICIFSEFLKLGIQETCIKTSLTRSRKGVRANTVTSSFGHQIRQVDKDAELAVREVGLGIDLDI